MSFSNLRPARTVQHHHSGHGRSNEAPMDYEYNSPRASIFNNRNNKHHDSEMQEPPRKRPHYETMDWSAEPPTKPSSILSQFASTAPHPYPSSSSSSPFIFDSTSIMQVDEPVHASQGSVGSVQSVQAQTRDIATGAIQRERRKRDKLKDWQVVKSGGGKSSSSVRVNEDDEQDGNSEDETQDDIPRNGPEDTPGLAGQVQRLLRRTRSSRRNQPPVHLSLHNHNYHYPSTAPSDPFVFGSTSALSATSNQPLLSASPHAVQIENPSHWWREEGPYILLGYLQFLFNTSLVLLALYFLISFLLMLSSDIRERTTEYSIELQQEIMHCSELYIQNRCQPEFRVPAMEKQCKNWEFCMNRNPKVVGRARVGAETLAEVVNGFTEVISWRTMLFLLAILAILVSFTNSTISSYRRSHTAYHSSMQNRMGQPYVSHDHRLQHSESNSKGEGEKRFMELK